MSFQGLTTSHVLETEFAQIDDGLRRQFDRIRREVPRFHAILPHFDHVHVLDSSHDVVAALVAAVRTKATRLRRSSHLLRRILKHNLINYLIN